MGQSSSFGKKQKAGNLKASGWYVFPRDVKQVYQRLGSEYLHHKDGKKVPKGKDKYLGKWYQRIEDAMDV